jgi:endonuclease YncB( thermonuclease family)
MTTFGPYAATVVSVHDGDTLRLLIDLGSGPYTPTDLGFGVQLRADAQISLNCRLYGINAPELSTDAGKAARDYLLSLVHPGDQVVVTSHGWDKYGGRFDGSVSKTPVGDLSTQMLDSGHAVPLAS